MSNDDDVPLPFPVVGRILAQGARRGYLEADHPPGLLADRCRQRPWIESAGFQLGALVLYPLRYLLAREVST